MKAPRLAATALLLYTACSNAETIAVFYPEVREPYATVFSQIIEGVRSVHADLETIGLGKDVDIDTLRASVNDSWEGVVALGSRGVNAARALELSVPVAVGGIISPRNSAIGGVSLTPDPKQLFLRLKALSPGTGSVSVVYSTAQNGWLMDRAKRAATEVGITFEAYLATDLAEAARVYRKILEKAPPGAAIWLPHDRATVDTRTILPFLLEAAWNRRLVLFSSTGAHAKRGVLFAMYPDHEKMGRRIGELLSSAMRGSGGGQIEPSRDLKTAVNVRTASHIGLQFTPETLETFDLVFPLK